MEKRPSKSVITPVFEFLIMTLAPTIGVPSVSSTTVPVRVRFLLFCETSRRLFCVSTSRTVRLLITNGVSATLNSLAAVTDNGQLNKQSSEYLSHPALLIKRSFSMFLDLDN